MSHTGGRVWECASLAVQMAELTQVGVASVIEGDRKIAKQSWREGMLLEKDQRTDAKVEATVSSAQLDTSRWEERYDVWYSEVFLNPKSNTPNEKQGKVLDLIHRRRLIEFGVEQGAAMDYDAECAEPLLRLIHGLPGSGKTELLLWIQTYFEDVWGWTLGNEFVFLAPLNSMASNCGGATVHSWGKIQFKDRRGRLIGNNKGEDELPTLALQCNAILLMELTHCNNMAFATSSDKSELQKHTAKFLCFGAQFV